MIDKKGRLFGKVSLVDLFAVVVIAAVFFVVYLYAGGRGRLELSEAQPVTITFYHPALQDFIAYHLTADVPVMDDDAGTYMGQVSAITLGESIHFSPNRQGQMIQTAIQGRYAVYIQTRVQGQLHNGAVVLNGTVYAIGDEVHLWAGDTRIIAHISNIQAGGGAYVNR
jgi:hypothetical protein